MPTRSKTGKFLNWYLFAVDIKGSFTTDKIKIKGTGWQEKFLVSTLSNVEVGRS